MKIIWNAEHKYFHLRTGEMSYLMGVTPDERLLHLYWGAALGSEDSAAEIAGEMLQSYVHPEGVDSKADFYSRHEVSTMTPGDYSSNTNASTHYLQLRPDHYVRCWKTLAYSDTGQNGTVTLSETAANFKMMQIVFALSNTAAGTDNSPYSFVEVSVPNGKHVDLSETALASDGKTIHRAFKTVLISGTSITVRKKGATNQSTANAISANVSDNNIYIHAVYGARW